MPKRIKIKSYRAFLGYQYKSVSKCAANYYVPEMKYYAKDDDTYKYVCGPTDFDTYMKEAEKQPLYLKDEVYDCHRSLKRRIGYTVAWLRFKYWQKHDLFNYSLSAHANLNDWAFSSKIDKLRKHASIMHDKLFPKCAVSGYTDGNTMLCVIADLLTSSALYMVYFGSTVSCTQRRMIREMWYARNLLRKAYNDGSLDDAFKYFTSHVDRWWD